MYDVVIPLRDCSKIPACEAQRGHALIYQLLYGYIGYRIMPVNRIVVQAPACVAGVANRKLHQDAITWMHAIIKKRRGLDAALCPTLPWSRKQPDKQ